MNETVLATIALTGFAVAWLRPCSLRGSARRDSAKAKTYLADFFDLLVHVTMDHRAWDETEKLAWSPDRAGKILPLTDFIIVVCALRAKASVLTRVHHSAMIPELRVARRQVAG